MFEDATAFNQNISGWTTTSVTTMLSTFKDATVFNQDISGWDVSSVTTMNSMFEDADAFNQNISGWTTTSLTDTREMFYSANLFDQDVGGWDITSLLYAADMFKYVTLSTANYDALLIGWAAQAVINGVTFHGGSSKYSSGAATTARANLVTGAAWDITDGGQV